MIAELLGRGSGFECAAVPHAPEGHHLRQLFKLFASNPPHAEEQHLPSEIAIVILAQLDLEDLLSCNQVCRAWAKLCDVQGVSSSSSARRRIADAPSDLWMRKCASHLPPIRPVHTTWADLAVHRHLQHLAADQNSSSASDDEGRADSSMDEASLHSDERFSHVDVLAAQGGLGGGGGIDPLAKPSPVRRDVWERSASGLPSHLHASSCAPTQSKNTNRSIFNDPPILSHLSLPTPLPTPNYKHLYIIHSLLSRRMHSAQPHSVPRSRKLRVRTIDAFSSFEAGGLPGHSEAIYSLELVRHSMSIRMIPIGEFENQLRPKNGPFDTLVILAGMSRGPARSSIGPGDGPVVVAGRDWLLSGSRDRTLRLWQMGCPTPRVVKVFHGGHTGSILSHFVVKLSTRNGQSERLMAVSGGSDGRICLWDIEHGDGLPEKEEHVHSDSVLCVKGDEQRVVSCSRGEKNPFYLSADCFR